MRDLSRCASTHAAVLASCAHVNRPPRNREKGAGGLKAIVWLVILGLAAYVGIKVVPVLFHEYEMTDGMQTIARFGTVNRQTPEQIQEAVLLEAMKDELPVTADEIKVTQVRGNVRISVEFAVIVDLGFYQWTLNFNPTAANDALY